MAAEFRNTQPLRLGTCICGDLNGTKEGIVHIGGDLNVTSKGIVYIFQLIALTHIVYNS